MIKIFSLLCCLVLIINTAVSQDGIGIGTEDVNPDAVLEVDSQTAGLLTPRMSTSQRNSIGASSEGLIVYDLDEESFFYFDGSVWQELMNRSTVNDMIQDALFSLIDIDIYINDYESSNVPVPATSGTGAIEATIDGISQSSILSYNWTLTGITSSTGVNGSGSITSGATSARPRVTLASTTGNIMNDGDVVTFHLEVDIDILLNGETRTFTKTANFKFWEDD